jgi:hypothetical protein
MEFYLIFINLCRILIGVTLVDYLFVTNTALRVIPYLILLTVELVGLHYALDFLKLYPTDEKVFSFSLSFHFFFFFYCTCFRITDSVNASLDALSCSGCHHADSDTEYVLNVPQLDGLRKNQYYGTVGFIFILFFFFIYNYYSYFFNNN